MCLGRSLKPEPDQWDYRQCVYVQYVRVAADGFTNRRLAENLTQIFASMLDQTAVTMVTGDTERFNIYVTRCVTFR